MGVLRHICLSFSLLILFPPSLHYICLSAHRYSFSQFSVEVTYEILLCAHVGTKILYLRSGFIDFKIKYKGILKNSCVIYLRKYFSKGKMLVSAFFFFFSLPLSLKFRIFSIAQIVLELPALVSWELVVQVCGKRSIFKD